VNPTRTHKRRALPLALAALVASLIALAGCGETGKAGAAGSPSPQASTATRRVALHLDVGSFSSQSSTATISGTVTPGATVTVNRRRASVHGHRWSRTLHLRLGENRVSVVATLTGRRAAHTSIVVTREKSSAEVEAETREQSAPAPTTSSSPEEAACTNGTYVNSAGKTVCRPEESPTVPAGATAECADGTYSFSESRSGTCSHHGGVARWLK
jgi:hypothetical protein